MARFGPFSLHTFTVLVNAGIAVALVWLYRSAPQGRATRWLDAGLAATVGGFAGARFLYALVNANYYLTHPEEIVQIWQGGLAWPGAVAGGLLGLWLYCSRKREPLAPVLDTLAVPLALLGLLSWGACLAASCAYGYEVTPGALPAWMVTTAPDLYGLSVPRWPTQAAGLLWSAVALAAVWSVRRAPWPAGARFAFALSLAALGPFGLGFTRGDPIPLVNGYRLDVIGSALVLVTSTGWWALRVAQKPAKTQTPPVVTNADP